MRYIKNTNTFPYSTVFCIYTFVLKMTMDSVSEENAERLLKDRDNKSKDLIEIQGTMIEEMWLKELGELQKYLDTPSVMKIKLKKK